MDKTQLGHVRTDIKNSVATIEFYHPSHNSLPGNLLRQLVEAINQAGDNDDVQVIVLKSGGDRTFCAGASFNELKAIKDTTTGKNFFMGFANVINAIRTCPKIVIGRVHGKAVGGGVGLASAVDYCMASKYASIKLSELAIGIGPFVIGPAVERKMGISAMSEMALNATEWRTAKWAQSRGLFAEVFETAEQLDAYIEHFTDKLVASNPEALRLLKRVFWEGTDHWGDLLEKRAEMSGTLVLSEFTKNALANVKA